MNHINIEWLIDSLLKPVLNRVPSCHVHQWRAWMAVEIGKSGYLDDNRSKDAMTEQEQAELCREYGLIDAADELADRFTINFAPLI